LLLLLLVLGNADFATVRRSANASVREMERTRAEEPTRGFTLIELLVVIATIAILASIAVPVFSHVQERARVTKDLNNLRQIGIATQAFLNDHDDLLFLPTDDWMTDLHPKYLGSWKVFLSPFDRRSPSESDTSAPISYGLNANAQTSKGALSIDQIVKPSEFILFAPARPFTKTAGDASATVSPDSTGPGGPNAGGTHSNGSHIDACFADLHVENLPWTTFHSDAPAPGSGASQSARWHPDPANPSL
jgi:prepilin-type N-terminal cleavage/methylation domain-containing protein